MSPDISRFTFKKLISYQIARRKSFVLAMRMFRDEFLFPTLNESIEFIFPRQLFFFYDKNNY